MTEQRLDADPPMPPESMVTGPGAGAEQEPSKAERAKEQAQQSAGQAKEQAQQVAGQAKEQAQAASEQAKQRAAAQVDERSTQAGQQIGAQAEAIGGVADELRRQGKEGPAKVVEQAGERVKQVGDYLERTDGETLMEAAKDAARENPAAAAAVGAAAGFAAGRVIKAARDEGPSEEDEPAGPAGGGA